MTRRTILVAAAMLTVLGAIAIAGLAQEGETNARDDYLDLLASADRLWERYKKADKAFFERERTDVSEHVRTLAEIHDQLGEVHAQWLQYEVPDELVVTDLKVGLALELQMAAIGAEVVGLFEESQGYLDLSSQLDAAYENVVDDL